MAHQSSVDPTYPVSFEPEPEVKEEPEEEKEYQSLEEALTGE
tara:strand:+ start:924 stop:1049 length:126 start_codon:yes stop_codon:yes gene_type:complete